MFHIDFRGPVLSRHQVSAQHDPLKLPYIALVPAIAEQRHCSFTESGRAIKSGLLAATLQRASREQRDLVPSLPERWYRDGACAKAITQILQQNASPHQGIRVIRHRQNYATSYRLHAV